MSDAVRSSDAPLDPMPDARAALARLGRLLGAHVYAGRLRADGSFEETFAGPGLEALLGDPPAPFDAQAVWQAAVDPDDRATVAAMHVALARGETVEAEYRLIGADGVVRHVLDRMQPRAAPGGRVLVEGVVIDVTPSGEPGPPEPQEALYVLALPADGPPRPLTVGPGWARVLGGAVGGDPGVIGEAWVASIHPADAGAFLAAREALRRGEPIERGYRMIGLDGVERAVVDRAVPTPGADGSMLAAGIVFDVTTERRAREELDDIRERLETVLAAVAEVVVTEQLLPDGRAAVFVGPGVEGLLGREVDLEHLSATWDAAVHPDDRPAFARHLEAVRGGRPADVEHRLIGLDGRTRWVALRSRPRRDAAGRQLVDGIAADVTARREEADVVAERARRLRSLVDAIDDVVLTIELTADGEVRPVLVGDGLEGLLGGPVPARAEPIEIWRAALHPDDQQAFASALAELRALRPVDHVHRVVGLDGVVRSVEWVARPRADGHGGVIVEGMLSDVSDEQRALHAIGRAHADAEARSRVDRLTGVANRLRLDEALDETTGPSALLALDVDHFKRVNDTHGHAVGDEVLVEVARRLGVTVRETDLVARPGGEEFAVLLRRVTDPRILRRIGEAVRVAVERPAFPTAAGPLAITVSVGAALGDAGGTDAPALVDAADAALYAAKRRGRNRVVLADELTADDLVAEDPAPLRLARALALAAGSRRDHARAETEAARIADELGLAPADRLAARAAAWLLDVDPAAIRAVRELADLAPVVEQWRDGAPAPDLHAAAQVLARLDLPRAA